MAQGQIVSRFDCRQDSYRQIAYGVRTTVYGEGEHRVLVWGRMEERANWMPYEAF